MQKGRLCVGVSEGLTSALPNLGIVFSFMQGVDFHPDPSRGQAPDNYDGRQESLRPPEETSHT